MTSWRWCQRPSTVGCWHHINDMIKYSTSRDGWNLLSLILVLIVYFWTFMSGSHDNSPSWTVCPQLRKLCDDKLEMMSATIDCWSLTSYWWHDQTFNFNTFPDVSQPQKPLETGNLCQFSWKPPRKDFSRNLWKYMKIYENFKNLRNVGRVWIWYGKRVRNERYTRLIIQYSSHNLSASFQSLMEEEKYH